MIILHKKIYAAFLFLRIYADESF